MMRPRRFARPLLLLLLVASCATPAPTTTTPAATATTTSTTPLETTSGTADLAPCLAGDQAFATDGALASGLLTADEGDAELVAGLRWAAHEGCERLVVELATAGGAPATEPGGVRAELLRNRGIVRLRLDDLVTSTALADQVVELELVDRVYVVRSLDGDLYVDIHLGSAVTARASVSRSPAEVIVDLQPGGPELISAPLVADNVVVVSPTGGRAGYPWTLDGYARTFEATVILRAHQDGQLEIEEITSAADYLVTWGEYRFELVDGPSGKVEFFVGEDSPENGQERGARFSLEMG